MRQQHHAGSVITPVTIPPVVGRPVARSGRYICITAPQACGADDVVVGPFYTEEAREHFKTELCKRNLGLRDELGLPKTFDLKFRNLDSAERPKRLIGTSLNYCCAYLKARYYSRS